VVLGIAVSVQIAKSDFLSANIVEAPKRLVQVEKQRIQDGLKNLWENEL
jgi:hypothetical protein